MFLRIASTPPVTAAPPKPLAGRTTAATGLGAVPYLVRRPGGRPVLHIPVAPFVFLRPRGVGQAYTSGACQYSVPGITPDPGIPFCGPGGYQMTPAQIASVLASQKSGGYGPVSTGAFSSKACPTDPNVVPPPGCFPGSTTNVALASPAQLAAAAAPASSSSSPSAPATVAPGQTSAPASSSSAVTTTEGSGPAPAYYATLPAGSSSGSFLDASVDVFGYSIPIWALGLAGVGLVWVMTKGKK
jgi:hypothetical protein